jgi:hypothetical protein
VNDPGHDERMVNIDPSLDKGKGKESSWFRRDGGQDILLGKNMMEDEHFEEGEEHYLPPRYSSIHPQHRARVQAWREEQSGTDDAMI